MLRDVRCALIDRIRRFRFKINRSNTTLTPWRKFVGHKGGSPNRGSRSVDLTTDYFGLLRRLFCPRQSLPSFTERLFRPTRFAQIGPVGSSIDRSAGSANRSGDAFSPNRSLAVPFRPQDLILQGFLSILSIVESVVTYPKVSPHSSATSIQWTMLCCGQMEAKNKRLVMRLSHSPPAER